MLVSPDIPLSNSLATCPDPLYRGLPIHFRRMFLPLGKRVQVESNDSAVMDAAVQSFQPYGSPSVSLPAEILIRLCVDPVAHEDGAWPVPVYRGLQHLFHIGCGNSNFAVADLKAGMAAGFVSREMARDRSFFRSTFLECLFHVLAVHQSHTPVHCACVALGQRGVLICGPSGAGKTTLAYACAKAGMQVVSDDVVHLECLPRSGAVRLWGNPWQLRLAPEASRLFPELEGRPAHLRSDHEWYLEVDVPREFPGQARTACEPAALVFLKRTNDICLECTRLESSVVLERLKQDVVLDEESVVERHYALLGRLAETQAHLLKYSGHPATAVAAIRNLLSS